MSQSAVFEFSGVVSKTNRLTGSSEGAYALVKLDAEVDGVKFAVVNRDTRGRIAVFNQVGSFQEGQRLKGQGTRGPEAISATFVELAPSA